MPLDARRAIVFDIFNHRQIDQRRTAIDGLGNAKDIMSDKTSTSNVISIESSLTSGVYGKRDVAFVRGAGSRVQDDQGVEYIDFVAGIGTLGLGHCPEKVVKAIQMQASRMISCTELYYNDARAELLERLDGITPDDYSRFFLCSSGTEAVEAAIKFARVTSGRKNFVAFERAFHGRSLGALSATAKKAIRDPFMPLVPGFSHVPFNDVDALEAAVDDETAAVIFEAIQGEGGINEISEEMAEALKRIQARGVMLIADEIQSGVFRTGKAFAFEHFGLVPEFICIAKALGAGMPIGAVALSKCVKEIPKGCHGSTYGGTPLACAAAAAVLRVMVEENLAERAVQLGDKIRGRIVSLNAPCVKEVRGRGLMIGIQLNIDAAKVVTALFERGLLIITAGENCLRLLPPFNTPEEDIEEALDLLADVLKSAS